MNKETFTTYCMKTEEERQEIIDSGMFNSIIEAYLVNTLCELNYPFAKISEAAAELRNILDELPAAEAVNRAKIISKLSGKALEK